MNQKSLLDPHHYTGRFIEGRRSLRRFIVRAAPPPISPQRSPLPAWNPVEGRQVNRPLATLYDTPQITMSWQDTFNQMYRLGRYNISKISCQDIPALLIRTKNVLADHRRGLKGHSKARLAVALHVETEPCLGLRGGVAEAIIAGLATIALSRALPRSWGGESGALRMEEKNGSKSTPRRTHAYHTGQAQRDHRHQPGHRLLRPLLQNRLAVSPEAYQLLQKFQRRLTEQLPPQPAIRY